MLSPNDTINTIFLEMGYTGSVDDMLYAYCRQYGDSSTIASIQDAQRGFLLKFGAPAYLDIASMWSWWLLRMGYEGDVHEQIAEWLLDGAPMQRDHDDRLILTTGDDLLLEDGSYILLDYERLLQESGDLLLLENSRFLLGYDGLDMLALEDDTRLLLEENDSFKLED
jgi:hypothetical protein